MRGHDVLLDVLVPLTHEGADRALDVEGLNMTAHGRGVLPGEGTQGTLDRPSRLLWVTQPEVLVQVPGILEYETATPALGHLLKHKH